MSGANLTKDPMDLARVAMPLVRLMRDGKLSWSQKQEIANVIHDLCNERKEWEREQAHIAGALSPAAAQAGIGSGLGGKLVL